MLTVAWPTCARCEAPVDSFETSPARRRGMLTVTAHCHGETEVAELPAIEADADERRAA